MPRARGAVAWQQRLDGGERKVEHGAGDLLGEGVVDIYGGNTDLFVIPAEDGDPKFPHVPVVGVEGTVQGDAQAEMVRRLHLVGVVDRGVMHLPLRQLRHS